MSELVEELLANRDITKAIEQCLLENNPNIARLIACATDNNYLLETEVQSESRQSGKIEKSFDILSTSMTDMYQTEGEILCVDFVKYLEEKGLPIHVYGNNKFQWVNYKGPTSTPVSYMSAYKYVLIVEDNFQKLVDGLRSECLVFYNGQSSIKVDEKAYIQLDLCNFKKAYKVIEEAINSNEWEKRLPYIQDAKLACNNI